MASAKRLKPLSLEMIYFVVKDTRTIHFQDLTLVFLLQMVRSTKAAEEAMLTGDNNDERKQVQD